MKKFLKIVGILLLLLLLFISAFYFINNEKLPEGKKGKEADALAIKMLNALNHEAYENTEVLEWSFRNTNHYKWLKNENIVYVNWDDKKVVLHTKSPEKSTASVNGKQTDDKLLIEKATGFFNNDSFWLVAPHKIFDPGTERRIVKHKDKDALLVTYTSCLLYTSPSPRD